MDDAITLAEEYQEAAQRDDKPRMAQLDAQVEVVELHQYEDHDRTCANELDAEGNWIEDGSEGIRD